LMSPKVSKTPPPSPAEFKETTVSSPHPLPLPVTSASPQDDDDSLDTDGFQEQFLLETPPPPCEESLRRVKEERMGTKTTIYSHRRTSSDVTVVQLEERKELASAEESELGEEEDLTETVSTRSEVTTDIEEASDTHTSIDLSDSELKTRPDQLAIRSSVKSPEEEKGAKDSKRAENVKYLEENVGKKMYHPVERLSGGVGIGKEVSKKDKETYEADSESREVESKKQNDKHIDRGTSPLEGKALSSPNPIPSPPDSSHLPAPGSRTNQPPPTLELVIGRKEVRTKEASATAESRLTLYGARDVEISIRSQSHISVTTTRREASGRETSEQLSPEVPEEPVGERRDVYIIPPPSSEPTEPQQTELTKEKKREETVIFSGKKSVYRYESLEAAGTPAFESPTTEDSVSHHITDTGISLTRGTTTDTITSPAQRPPGEIFIDDHGVLSDTAVDVGAEEAELTDAGLSPIQADDVGLGMPSTELMFLEEEIVLAHYCDAASSPVEFQHIETTSVALSPLQVETSEASVSTDQIDTRDASVSPIRAEGSSPPAQERVGDEIVRVRRDSGDVRALIRLLEEGAQRMQPVPSKETKKSKDDSIFSTDSETEEIVEKRVPSPKHKIAIDEPIFTKEDTKIKEIITAQQAEEKDTYPHMSQVIETIEKRIATESQQMKPSPLKYITSEVDIEEKVKPSLVEERLTQLVKAEEQVLKKIEEVITFVEESSNRKEFLAYLEQSEETVSEEVRTERKFSKHFGLQEEDIYIKGKQDIPYLDTEQFSDEQSHRTLEEHIEQERQKLLSRSKREIEIEETEQIAKEIAELKQLLPSITMSKKEPQEIKSLTAIEMEEKKKSIEKITDVEREKEPIHYEAEDVTEKKPIVLHEEVIEKEEEIAETLVIAAPGEDTEIEKPAEKEEEILEEEILKEAIIPSDEEIPVKIDKEIEEIAVAEPSPEKEELREKALPIKAEFEPPTKVVEPVTEEKIVPIAETTTIEKEITPEIVEEEVAITEKSPEKERKEEPIQEDTKDRVDVELRAKEIEEAGETETVEKKIPVSIVKEEELEEPTQVKETTTKRKMLLKRNRSFYTKKKISRKREKSPEKEVPTSADKEAIESIEALEKVEKITDVERKEEPIHEEIPVKIEKEIEEIAVAEPSPEKEELIEKALPIKAEFEPPTKVVEPVTEEKIVPIAESTTIEKEITPEIVEEEVAITETTTIEKKDNTRNSRRGSENLQKKRIIRIVENLQEKRETDRLHEEVIGKRGRNSRNISSFEPEPPTKTAPRRHGIEQPAE
ncbi:hypothetical protein L9F63_018545, partial [Diploptera punctata]